MLLVQEILDGFALRLAAGRDADNAFRMLDEPTLKVFISVVTVFCVSVSASKLDVSVPYVP